MLSVGGDRKIITALTRLYCQGRQFSVTEGGEVANMDGGGVASCSRCCYLSCHISFKRALWFFDTKFEL